MTMYQKFYTLLNKLQAGQRAWFWLCLDVTGDDPPLLLTPLKTDARMDSLRAMYSNIALKPGSAVSMGIASVTPQGTLQLCGPHLSENTLLRLAHWAEQNIADHPELARLKGLALLNTADGMVTARHTDDEIWSELPDTVAPGTLAETALRLKKLKPGRNFWYWLTDRGPDDAPFLALGSTSRDPQGARFADHIQQLRRQSTERGAELNGVLRLTTAGNIVLTCEAPLQPAVAVLAALAREPGLSALQTARLIRMEGGQLAEVIVAQPDRGVDLSAQVTALSAVAEDAPVWFWFTAADQDGAPALLLSADRDALKGAVKSARGSGAELRGRVTLSSKGWLHFQARTPYTDFIPALAQWVSTHHTRWPGLTRLRDARLTCTDKSGHIISREKNDAAWAALG